MKTFSRLFLLVLFSAAASSGFGQHLVNPNAIPQAKALKAYLDATFQHKIISGQVDDSYLSLIESETGGKDPAIVGYDFNGITPSGSGNNDADKAIAWVKNHNGIASFQWHWASPNGGGSSNWNAGDFDLAGALANPSGSSYQNMIRDIDLVAAAMQKMQDAGVPILWRPLHEAEGQWFWWGASGKSACQQLWAIMYDRLVNYHHLNNLIWVWNSYGTEKGNWYPGDNTVDIIAWDYEDSTSWSQYQQLFGSNGKPFGLAEEGKLPDPANFSARPWLYFECWAYMIQESYGKGNTAAWVNYVYNDPRVVTLSDLPSTLYGGLVADAGPDQTVSLASGASTASVTLDGSHSANSGGTITSYVWSESGTTVATGATATISLAQGVHTLTLTVTSNTGTTNSDQVVITVNLPNLALNKPVTVSSTEANSTNVAANAVDGNTSTRWSSAYADPQWITIDLQATYAISAVTLRWEAASASAYRIDVSNDGTNWTTIATRSNQPAGPRTDSLTGLAGSGRYVRMYGTARNTQWGYSLYEFEVNGTAGQNVPVTGISVSPTSATLTSVGQTVSIVPAVTPTNATNKGVTFSSSNTSVATVDSTGKVTAVAGGTAVITATTADGGYQATSAVTVSIATATNLALNKPVTVSSTEANYGNVAANAVDGNTTTRWSSAYSDPQWITVDLQGTYAISGVTLQWETGSASAYHVDVSADGTNWTTIATRSNQPAGPRTDTLTGLSGTGRYVRMYGTARNTQWGYSLYEFQVFGTAAQNVSVTGVTLTPTSATLTAAGQTTTLTATVSPSNATNRGVTFTSSVPAVATVDASGKVTAVGNGTTLITATTSDGGYTATSTVTVSISSGGGGGQITTASVGFAVSSDWGTGYSADVTIKNNGTQSINGWKVTFTLPAGVSITNLWNGTYTVSGQTVTVTNVDYNGSISPGASTSFGYSANGPSTAPSDFAVYAP